MKTPTTDRWRYRKSKTPYHSEDEVGYEALAIEAGGAGMIEALLWFNDG